MGVTRRQMVTRSGSGLVAGAVVACAAPGTATQQDGAPKPGGSGQPVTLRLGGRGANPSVNWDEFNAGKRKFEARYPNITLEITPDMNADKFLAAAAAGDAWDVQDLCCDQIPIEARAGVIAPIDAYLKKSAREMDAKDWHDLQVQYFVVDGKQYAFGKYMGTVGLYYNKSWFREKGVAFPDETWDWNKYRDAMIRLSDPANSKWGGDVQFQELSGDRRQPKALQNGGTMVDPKDDLKCTLDHPKTIEAFEWIHDRIWLDNCSPQPAQRPGAAQGWKSRELWGNGHIAMYEDGSWAMTSLVTITKPNFEWDVAPLPRGPAQRATMSTTDAWAMWKETKRADDAWLLMTFFNSDDWYEVITGNRQPSRKSWVPKWEKLTSEAFPALAGKNFKAFLSATEQNYGYPWYLLRYHAATNALINEKYALSVLNNQAPVRATHVELTRQVNEIQATEQASRGGK